METTISSTEPGSKIIRIISLNASHFEDFLNNKFQAVQKTSPTNLNESKSKLNILRIWEKPWEKPCKFIDLYSI